MGNQQPRLQSVVRFNDYPVREYIQVDGSGEVLNRKESTRYSLNCMVTCSSLKGRFGINETKRTYLGGAGQLHNLIGNTYYTADESRSAATSGGAGDFDATATEFFNGHAVTVT